MTDRGDQQAAHKNAGGGVCGFHGGGFARNLAGMKVGILQKAVLMLPGLKLIYKKLLSEVTTEHHRFLYDEFNLEDRLTGLVGPRGLGKTTLMLQLIQWYETGLVRLLFPAEPGNVALRRPEKVFLSNTNLQ